MTKEDIQQNNKLIAEFLGYKYVTGSGWILSQYDNKESIPPHILKTNQDVIIGRHHRDLRYYNSWDWLMKAVEKLESLRIFTDVVCPFEIIINYNICFINWEVQHQTVYPELCFDEIYKCKKTKIEATYEAIIEFIIWYNKQTKEK